MKDKWLAYKRNDQEVIRLWPIFYRLQLKL